MAASRQARVTEGHLLPHPRQGRPPLLLALLCLQPAAAAAAVVTCEQAAAGHQLVLKCGEVVGGHQRRHQVAGAGAAPARRAQGDVIDVGDGVAAGGMSWYQSIDVSKCTGRIQSRAKPKPRAGRLSGSPPCAHLSGSVWARSSCALRGRPRSRSWCSRWWASISKKSTWAQDWGRGCEQALGLCMAAGAGARATVKREHGQPTQGEAWGLRPASRQECCSTHLAFEDANEADHQRARHPERHDDLNLARAGVLAALLGALRRATWRSADSTYLCRTVQANRSPTQSCRAHMVMAGHNKAGCHKHRSLHTTVRSADRGARAPTWPPASASSASSASAPPAGA